MDKQDKPVVATCLVAVGILLGMAAASTCARAADGGPQGQKGSSSRHSATGAERGSRTPTSSSDWTFGIHLGSKHWPAKDWNNFNPGLYLKSPSGYTGGFYYNSQRHWSIYLGYTHEFEWRVMRWQPAVTAGLVTGYEAGILPLLMPSVARDVGKLTRVRLSGIPKILCTARSLTGAFLRSLL